MFAGNRIAEVEEAFAAETFAQGREAAIQDDPGVALGDVEGRRHFTAASR